MYFSNINNEELKKFHKVFPCNFSMSLSNILSSNLFVVETIIPDRIYRIFLQFYCNNITSTNPDNVILENKCIICKKEEYETYFNFISDNQDLLVLRQKTYYSIGSHLNDDDFNSIVQLLRQNNDFVDNITIKNSLVKGKYGDYLFDLNSTTIVDIGVLITNETLSNLGTVKLLNPVFKNSNYKLKLIVYSLMDVNVCDEASNNNITKSELIIDLLYNQAVNIPFNTLNLDCIVGFKGIVDITHDNPVIEYPTKIDLSANKSTIFVGENVMLTATCTKQSLPLLNKDIVFKLGDETIGQGNTGTTGIANLNYQLNTTGNLNIVAVTDNGTIVSNTLKILSQKHNASLIFEVNSQSIEIGTNLTISGQLKSGNTPLSQKQVIIIKNKSNWYTVPTGNDGKFSKTIKINELVDLNLKVKYGGNYMYNSCETEYKNVKSKNGVKVEGKWELIPK